MTLLMTLANRVFLRWLDFWYGVMAPHTQWALIRISTALVTLYVLFVRSYDLDPEVAHIIRSDPGILGSLETIAWPFSVFSWGEGETWIWSMHIVAIVLATALLAGFLSPLMAALSLFFQLSYAHFNPAMVLGLDGLVMLALTYLMLVSSGKVLGVFSLGGSHPPPLLAIQPASQGGIRDPRRSEAEQGHPLDRLPWSGLVLRVMQIHLCLLYFQSGLAKLSTDWLAGTALWHPRWSKLGVPYTLETLQAAPHLTGMITYSLVLFELFYGVLIWVPTLRYGVLALSVVVHLSVGIFWGMLPFNLMMLVMNLAFLNTRHMEALSFGLRGLLFGSDSRGNPSQSGLLARFAGRITNARGG